MQDFTLEFKNKSDAEIINEILMSDHVYKKIQLLGLLLDRQDENFHVTPEVTVIGLLEELNKTAGTSVAN